MVSYVEWQHAFALPQAGFVCLAGLIAINGVWLAKVRAAEAKITTERQLMVRLHVCTDETHLPTFTWLYVE